MTEKTIWVDTTDDRVIYTREDNGVTRGEPGFDIGENIVFSHTWLNGEFSIKLEKIYPGNLPMNRQLESQFIGDENCTPPMMESVTSTINRLWSKAESLLNNNHGEYRKVLNKDYIHCCLPVHHGVHVMTRVGEDNGIDAIIDYELAPLVEHIDTNHHESIQILESCQGGLHNHTVSGSSDNDAGYIAFTGSRPVMRQIISEIGEAGFMPNGNIIEAFPEWTDVAVTVDEYATLVSWITPQGRDRAMKIIANAVCTGGCHEDIEKGRYEVERSACDWCGGRMSDHVKLAI